MFRATFLTHRNFGSNLVFSWPQTLSQLSTRAYERERNVIVFRDVLRAFMFLHFSVVSFFGTGNITSLNSFDPRSISCLVSVFSPFLMGGLLLSKVQSRCCRMMVYCCIFIFTRCDKVTWSRNYKYPSSPPPSSCPTRFRIYFSVKIIPNFQKHTEFSKLSPNFQNYDLFSKSYPIFKIILNFQNHTQFSKLYPIFKIISNFLNYTQFFKLYLILNYTQFSQ
jgi:hypothetical protein